MTRDHEAEPTDDASTDSQDGTIDRRELLKATGAGAIATSLAGCNFGGLTSQSFAATPFALGSEGMARLGFEERTHEKAEETRTFSGVDAEVTVTNHLVSYGRDASVPEASSWQRTFADSWSAGVLSTPTVPIGGEKQNPLATRPLAELLVGDRSKQLLSAVGVDAPSWAVEPRRLGSLRGEMLGQGTEIEVHVGVVEADGGPVVIALYGARVVVDGRTAPEGTETGGDETAVIAGAVDRRSLPANASVEDCQATFSVCASDDDRQSIRDVLGDLPPVYQDVTPRWKIPRDPVWERAPTLSIENPRLVQMCERTELTSGGAKPIDRPPLADNEKAAPVFGISGKRLQHLPKKGVRAEVTVTTGNGSARTERFLIPRRYVEKMNKGASPPATFHRLQRLRNANQPPIFDQRYGRATIKLIPHGSTIPYAKTSWKLDSEYVDTLRVGFVHIKDSSSKIDWGDLNGEATNYRRSVASSYEYLKRVCPGPVVAYRHDPPMPANPRESTKNAVAKDAWEARRMLNGTVQHASFPKFGAILNEDDPPVSAKKLLSTFGLDVVVMVLPKGTAGGHSNYYAAHGMGNVIGLYQGGKWAVGSLEALQGTNDIGHATTTAQEVGHYFAAKPYDDGRTDPYARNNSDVAHANANLESVGYSLVENRFSLINDISLTGGIFNSGTVKRGANGLATTPTHTSFMSYTGGNRWADNRITKYFLRSHYQNRYSGGSPSLDGAAGAGTAAAADGGDPEEVRPVFEAHGRTADGAVVLDRSAVFDGHPVDTADVDVERRLADNDAEPVEMALLGPEDEPRRTTVVPDRHQLPHGEGTSDAVAVSLPFDERGVWLRADYGDQRTRLNAVVHPLRDAVRRIPDRGFTNDEGRGRLLGLLDEADAAMREREYEQAIPILRDEFAAAVESAVASYESLAGQPTAERLLALTERQASHLAGAVA